MGGPRIPRAQRSTEHDRTPSASCKLQAIPDTSHQRLSTVSSTSIVVRRLVEDERGDTLPSAQAAVSAAERQTLTSHEYEKSGAGTATKMGRAFLSVDTSASPPLVKDVAKARPASFGIMAKAPGIMEAKDVPEWRPCAGEPRKSSESSMLLETAVKLRAPGQAATPPKESNGSNDNTRPAQDHHTNHVLLKLDLSRRKTTDNPITQHTAWDHPAMAVSESSVALSARLARSPLKATSGEQADVKGGKEANEDPEKYEGRIEGRGAEESVEKEGARKQTAEGKGQMAYDTIAGCSPSEGRATDNSGCAQDYFTELPTPAGKAPQVLAECAQIKVDGTTALVEPQQFECPGSKDKGETNELAQPQHRAFVPAWSGSQLTGSAIETLGKATGPRLGLENITSDNSDIEKAAPSVGEEATGPNQTAEGQTWADYKARSAWRQQRSSPKLVIVRRTLVHNQLSVDLTEGNDSDDTFDRSHSSSPADEKGSLESLQQSAKGKSRRAQLMARAAVANTGPVKAQLTRATTAKIEPAESRAAMVSRKYLKLFSPSNSAHVTYQVLATIHRTMNGVGWARRGGWGSYLVRRSRAELDEGRVYGVKSKEGRVELVILSSNNLRGLIPSSIARLESLKCINFADNHLSGVIPVELGLLLQLQTLQLQGNKLRGSIPPVLGSLISLVRLSLGKNKLSGPLPDSLGNLIHLRHFAAERNRLTGPIPSFMCNMVSLQTLNLSNNELSGAIPEGIGALARLKKLDLANNQFSGSIPASLGALSALAWLRLDNNQLAGPVPASLANLSALLILNLSFNRLSGPLPTALGTLMDLTLVSLRGNLLRGPLPFPDGTRGCWASRASGMRALDVGSNEIEEPFPDVHGMLQLQSLVMDSNRIYGRLAEGLAEACPNLSKLHLQNNRLSGEIPHNLGTLTKLEVLDLSDNSFDGSLPPSMESLQLLDTFSASNNTLSGKLPSFLGSLSALTSLALDGNKFTGPVPPELGNLTLLKHLYLEKNELVGLIPNELSKCTSLEELYLHDNKLWGAIPRSFRALRRLRYLYMYRNKLTGTIPEWLGELSLLRGLLLGENRLTGHIPWQLGHLHKVQDLFLNDNDLQGSIPERLINCECLQRLYLGGNRLTGTIPRELRHVPDLREFNIEKNNMHGEIPIPLFLKPSLGPNACGLKWAGNPRLVDSRHHFASIVDGARRRDQKKGSPSSGLRDHHKQRDDKRQGQNSGTSSSFERELRRPSQLIEPRSNPSSRGECLHGYKHGQMQQSRDFGDGGGIGVLRGGFGKFRGDTDGAGRLWDTNEDTFYFLFKIIAGNASVLFDYVVAARLYTTGCVWGCALVMLWRAMAGCEGVLSTRRLGYGLCWLPASGLGLALTWQARKCYHHNCESDLFQELQQVEWRWHAMVQLTTQLAVALSWWDLERAGHCSLVILSLGTKTTVVGITTMQRLDDKRLTLRHDRWTAAPPRTGPKVFVDRNRVSLWLSGSAWPRLFFVGFHMAEVCERTIPLALLIAALGKQAYFAPLAIAPGMFARYLVRRSRTLRPGGRRGGGTNGFKSALKLSLALDSAYGAGTSIHVFATLITTLEAISFKVFASQASRDYPDKLYHHLLYSMSAMFAFTWGVVVLEMVIRAGGEREREVFLLPPTISSRLAGLPSNVFPTPQSRQGPTQLIYVQPSTSSLELESGITSASKCQSMEGGFQQPFGRGGQRVSAVLPTEG